MVDIATIAFYLGVIAYSVAATLFFLDLARKDGGAVRAQWAPRLLASGGVLHAVHVVTASLLSRVCPIDSLHFALSFTALIAVGAYLALRERLRLVRARGVHRADRAHVPGGRAVRRSEQRSGARRVAHAAHVSHRGQRAAASGCF